MSKITIQNAKKQYGDTTVIEGLNLEIRDGELFTLLGPSGCGKTTLLRMIAGFNSIEGGDFYFNEERINDKEPSKRNIGMVFQNYAIFPHMTVAKNVAYGLKNRKTPKDEIARETDRFLEIMQIKQYADRLDAQEWLYPDNYVKLRFLENHDRARAAHILPEETVRRNWMRNFKLNANYNYGSSDIYNQNYQDSNIPIWTTTTTGREQSWWNVGASLSIPLDEIFNRRNKIKQQKKRIENTQYDLDRWYDELRMKIIDAYTTAVEQLSILRSAAEAKITSEAQYRMTEVDFVKGKLDAQTLSRQKSLENSATREYEQVRRNLNDALLRLEILTHTPIINKPISMPGVSKEAPETE